MSREQQKAIWAAWRRLAIDVLLLAFKDVRAGRGHAAEAREFLASEGTGWLLDLLDLDPELRQVLAAGEILAEGASLAEAVEATGYAGDHIKELIHQGLVEGCLTPGDGWRVDVESLKAYQDFRYWQAGDV